MITELKDLYSSNNITNMIRTEVPYIGEKCKENYDVRGKKSKRSAARGIGKREGNVLKKVRRYRESVCERERERSNHVVLELFCHLSS